MKKLTCLVLCVLFVGGLAVAQTGVLGKKTVQMLDNFEYGEGYNGTITDRNLLGGAQIKAGESYKLKVTFTASRDLESKLMFVLVDTTERANWWTQLIETADIFPDKVIKKGETITFEVTVKTIKDATSATPSANALVFMTEGKGTKGKKGSGALKPFNLDFTELTLTKL